MAGPYAPQFEVYWHRLDAQESGKVAPMVAAQFLKLSGLSDQTLGKVGAPALAPPAATEDGYQCRGVHLTLPAQVWDLSDPDGRGYLDKTGVFVACKLVALSQSGRELLTESLLDAR